MRTLRTLKKALYSRRAPYKIPQRSAGMYPSRDVTLISACSLHAWHTFALSESVYYTVCLANVGSTYYGEGSEKKSPWMFAWQCCLTASILGSLSVKLAISFSSKKGIDFPLWVVLVSTLAVITISIIGRLPHRTPHSISFNIISVSLWRSNTALWIHRCPLPSPHLDWVV